MALKLSLKPGEKFVVNGAVIANGDRRTSLVLHNHAAILREKDIMQEEEATSPARKIYFPLMLLYIDEKGFEQYFNAFTQRMTEFMGVVQNPEIMDLCVRISKDVMSHNYYKAIMTCKKLIAYEEELLNNVAESIPASPDVG